MTTEPISLSLVCSESHWSYQHHATAQLICICFRYLSYFNAWVETNPAFAGAADDSDVWFPGATGPLALPYHFTKTFVHFLPGGYVNGKTVRISYCGNTKFNFLKEDILRDTIQEYVLHIHQTIPTVPGVITGR